MHIIEVIPLINLPHNAPQILSYFFDGWLEKGVIVEISLNNRKVKAVVISSTPIEQQKISVKKSEFQLKKILKVISEKPRVSDDQFKIALWLSKTYYAPLGLCLKSILPQFLLKKNYESKIINREINEKDYIKKPIFILTPAKKILKIIEPYIKETIKNEGQTLIILPDKTVMDYFYSQLSDKYKTVKINSGLTNKQYSENWVKVSSGKTQIIIGTRLALLAPFRNLKIIIVEDPLNESYKSDSTPKYNTPDLAKKIAELNGAKIVLMSQAIGIENYYRIQKNEYEIVDNAESNNGLIKILDTTKDINAGNFSTFTREFKNKIISTINENKKVLIFSPRKGYLGLLLCENCKLPIKCPSCDIAMRVHRTTNFVLVCHHCSTSLSIPQFCPNCNSYKLKTTGTAGSQKIFDEIQNMISNGEIKKIPVLILDADVIKNETEENEVMDEIIKNQASILIATQMAFSHRFSQKFDFIGLTSIDALVNFPDFKVEEKTLYQLEKIMDFEPDDLFIQTYNFDNPINSIIGRNDYEKFYTGELETRKLFFYPPFSRLVKLMFRHKDQQKAFYASRTLNEKLKIAAAQMRINDKIKIIGSSPAFISKERNLYNYNIIIKMAPEFNPKDILKFVPAGWIIDIDPVRLL